MQEKLIRLCGGVNKTEALQRLWKNTYPRGRTSKQDVFREAAKKEGYKKSAIEWFIIC